MNFEALRDVDICTFIVKEAVVALTSQVVSLGVSSAILQDCRQSDNRVQEHILPDLTQGNIDMTFKEELERIRLVLKL